MTTPILIYGHTGALGREIAKQHGEAGGSAYAVHAELKAQVPGLIAFLREAKPSAVINCAAMTGYDRCFHSTDMALLVNGKWPLRLGIACQEVGIPLLHFSTEAVFACNFPGKVYGETDPMKPTTVYGDTKRLGEPPAHAYVVRLPLLFGPTNDKQLVAKLVRALMRGEDVRASIDLYSTPMYTPTVAAFVLKWLADPSGLERTLHLGSDGTIALHDLVAHIAKGVKAEGRLRPALCRDFPSDEKMPQHGGLRSDTITSFSLDAGILKYCDYINANREAFLNEP